MLNRQVACPAVVMKSQAYAEYIKGNTDYMYCFCLGQY